jgi:hypothetical protein
MHRIPLNLDLTAIRGLEVIQISLGQHEVIIKLHPASSITLEGGWVLRTAAGRIVDRSMEHGRRKDLKLHRLIGQRVEGAEVLDDHHMRISFGDLKLEISSAPDRPESFSIMHPGFTLFA